MKEGLGRCGPWVALLYFAGAFAFTVISFHPLVLLVSYVTSLVYIAEICGRWKRFLLSSIPFLLFVTALNVLVNHRGETVLFRLNRNPVTLEAVAYGFSLACMVQCSVQWFYCFGKVMTEDKIMAVLGGVSSNFSLLISMILRFIPRYSIKYREIVEVQKLAGNKIEPRHPVRSIVITVKSISMLLTWAFENSVETVDSMKARGYGLFRRSSYRNISPTKRDKRLVGAECACLLALSVLHSGLKAAYSPSISVSWDLWSFLFAGLFLAFCLLPVFLKKREDYLWSK